MRKNVPMESPAEETRTTGSAVPADRVTTATLGEAAVAYGAERNSRARGGARLTVADAARQGRP